MHPPKKIDDGSGQDEVVVPTKKTWITIRNKEYGITNITKMWPEGEFTFIEYETNAGLARRTKVLTSEITQIDEEL